MSNIIYHYCSMDTFDTIMKNKTIRLSDITKSNDSKEKQLVFERLENALDLSFSRLNVGVSATDIIRDGFAEGGTYLEYFLEDLKVECKQCSLVACFSRKGDLLSQWRGYADDGCGFAIGFDMDLLDKYLWKDNRFTISAVEYDNQKQLCMIDEDVRDTLLEFIYLFDMDKELKEQLVAFNDVLDDISLELVSRLNTTTCLMKMDSFYEEDEVRIVCSSGINIELGDNNVEGKIKGTSKVRLEDVNYLKRGNQLVMYADMNFEKAINDGIIKEIIIGPKVNMSVEEVKNYLWIRGYGDILVKKSNLSYR